MSAQLLPHLNILPGPAHVQDLITRHRRGRREPDIRTCSYCEASLLPGSDIQLAYDCSFCSQTCRARFMCAEVQQSSPLQLRHAI